jgi:hypothetical protein
LIPDLERIVEFDLVRATEAAALNASTRCARCMFVSDPARNERDGNGEVERSSVHHDVLGQKDAELLCLQGVNNQGTNYPGE